jgi:hypothetical protein
MDYDILHLPILFCLFSNKPLPKINIPEVIITINIPSSRKYNNFIIKIKLTNEQTVETYINSLGL